MDHKQTNIEPGQTVELAKLADYAPGAIVSKTLIQGPKGSITLFSLDKGQSISEHTTPFDALVLVLEGQAKISIGGNALSVKAGEAVLMPGGVPHALSAEARFKMLLVMIKQ